MRSKHVKSEHKNTKNIGKRHIYSQSRVYMSPSPPFSMSNYLKMKNIRLKRKTNKVRQRKASPTNKFSISRFLLVITRLYIYNILCKSLACFSLALTLAHSAVKNNGQTQGDRTYTHQWLYSDRTVRAICICICKYTAALRFLNCMVNMVYDSFISLFHSNSRCVFFSIDI